jgi:hypothetical protein
MTPRLSNGLLGGGICTAGVLVWEITGFARSFPSLMFRGYLQTLIKTVAGIILGVLAGLLNFVSEESDLFNVIGLLGSGFLVAEAYDVFEFPRRLLIVFLSRLRK